MGLGGGFWVNGPRPRVIGAMVFRLAAAPPVLVFRSGGNFVRKTEEEKLDQQGWRQTGWRERSEVRGQQLSVPSDPAERPAVDRQVTPTNRNRRRAAPLPSATETNKRH